MNTSTHKGITYPKKSKGSLELVPQLTAFHQEDAMKSLAEQSCSIHFGNTYVFRQLREQWLEKCGLFHIAHTFQWNAVVHSIMLI